MVVWRLYLGSTVLLLLSVVKSVHTSSFHWITCKCQTLITCSIWTNDGTLTRPYAIKHVINTSW